MRYSASALPRQDREYRISHRPTARSTLRSTPLERCLRKSCSPSTAFLEFPNDPGGVKSLRRRFRGKTENIAFLIGRQPGVRFVVRPLKDVFENLAQTAVGLPCQQLCWRDFAKGRNLNEGILGDRVRGDNGSHLRKRRLRRDRQFQAAV